MISEPKCQKNDLEITEFNTITPKRMHLNDIVQIGCVRGYDGYHIQMRCQKKLCKKESGCKIFWKPLNRTADRKKIKTVTCSGKGNDFHRVVCVCVCVCVCVYV